MGLIRRGATVIPYQIGLIVCTAQLDDQLQLVCAGAPTRALAAAKGNGATLVATSSTGP